MIYTWSFLLNCPEIFVYEADFIVESVAQVAMYVAHDLLVLVQYMYKLWGFKIKRRRLFQMYKMLMAYYEGCFNKAWPKCVIQLIKDSRRWNLTHATNGWCNLNQNFVLIFNALRHWISKWKHDRSRLDIRCNVENKKLKSLFVISS